jgi:hypothetical protein
MTKIEDIQECMKNKETNDFYFNYLLGVIIDIVNPDCLDDYGRFYLFGDTIAGLFTKDNINYEDLIKICLYALISRLMLIYITAFINIKKTLEIPKELENIDWDYIKNRCSKSFPSYTKFLDTQLKLLDEKSVLLFNREKRKLFKNKCLFEDVPFQMPIPEGLKPNDLDFNNAINANNLSL